MTRARDIANFGDGIDATDLSSGAVEGAMVTPSGRRNLIINGDFKVWQRGTSFSTITYTADRWYQTWNGTGTTRTTSKQNPDQSLWGDFSTFLRVANTVAPTGQTWNNLVQRIEDVKTAAGKTVTCSFKARSSSSTTLSVFLAQNFGSGGSSAVGIGTGFSEVLTTDWVDYTFTVAIPSIAGKTIGSSHFLELGFDFPRNSTFEIDIANVQLEVGSVATPFEHRSYGEELALCRRYFWAQVPKGAAGGGAGNAAQYQIGIGSYLGAGQIDTSVYFPVEMRAAPSCTIPTITSSFVAEAQGGNDYFNALAAWSQKPQCSLLFSGNGVSGTGGQAARIAAVHADTYIYWDAEL